jgi:hypothetical protein
VVTILLSVLKVKGAVWGYNSAVVTFTFLVRGAAQVDVGSGGLFVLRAIWHLVIPGEIIVILLYLYNNIWTPYCYKFSANFIQC